MPYGRAEGASDRVLLPAVYSSSGGIVIPGSHVNLRITGTAGDSEIFYTGFWVGEVDYADLAAFQTQVDNWANLSEMGAFLSAIRALNGADTRINALKGYYYNLPSNEAHFIAQHDFSGLAGTSGNITAMQTCAVISLYAVANGRRNRGRMYIPANAVPYDEGHYLGASQMTALATAAEDLINAFYVSSTSEGWRVVSRVGTTSALVARMKVDNRPDIQRRRANRQQPSVTIQHTVGPAA